MLEVGAPIVTKKELLSRSRVGHTHLEGTQGNVLQRLGPREWVVELHIPDESLAGGAWYECFDVRTSEIEIQMVPGDGHFDALRNWQQQMMKDSAVDTTCEGGPEYQRGYNAGWLSWFDHHEFLFDRLERVREQREKYARLSAKLGAACVVQFAIIFILASLIADIL